MSLIVMAKYAAVGIAGGVAIVGARKLTNRFMRRSAVTRQEFHQPHDETKNIPPKTLAVAKRIVNQRDWDGLMRTPSAVELIENCSDELHRELLTVEQSIAIDNIALHERAREFEDRTELVMHDIIKQHAKADLAKQARIVNARIQSAGSVVRKNRSIAAVV